MLILTSADAARTPDSVADARASEKGKVEGYDNEGKVENPSSD
jgi:hypothetical protein